ncbi:MAG: hypothetical protein C5B55_06730 [Blastocatellia bacterium]|nr:MAG: hypothetical protein C5B55_06730 [Blastocatellia bacterium]
MSYDVVVVGAGIGGLTVAALLSSRGINTCLLERQSQVGGCVARVEFAQHYFDPGVGIYPEWAPNQIHQRIFSELPVESPSVSLLDKEIVVRLESGTDVYLYKDDAQFFTELQRVFPECSKRAIELYRDLTRSAELSEKTITQGADSKKSIVANLRRVCSNRAHYVDKPLLHHISDTSPNFQAFIAAQLNILTHTSLEDANFFTAALVLSLLRQSLYSIHGGPAMLAERLAESIVASGGRVRLDTPVLRLAYDNNGTALGVDLLSGETVLAKHAIVSNLTIWDTYGKLVGLNRTPTEVKTLLANLPGSGAYVLYASLEDAARSRLPSSHILFDSRNEGGPFSFSVAHVSTHNAPTGKRSVTVTTPADVNEWFAYQSSPDDVEQWDQTALETIWQRLHRALPELGGDIEVVETSNPRTIYDSTRRKLGMVLGSGQVTRDVRSAEFETTLPNVFIVSDTVSPLPNVASVSQSALLIANKLTKLIKR